MKTSRGQMCLKSKREQSMQQSPYLTSAGVSLRVRPALGAQDA